MISAKLCAVHITQDEMMNQSWQVYKQKNRQWRAIIWMSLFLIFGKGLGHWTYHLLGIDQVYSATTAVVKKVGLTDVLTATNETPLPVQLIMDVKNDTLNDYTIESKPQSGHVDFSGQTFAGGEVKRFTIKPYDTSSNASAAGDIIFLSAPQTGSKNQTCQEIHTLNYDLKYAQKIKQPLVVNLSAINSKLECKDNSNTHADEN